MNPSFSDTRGSHAFLILFFTLFAGTALPAADLTVHAATSLSDALREIGAEYQKTSEDRLQFNFGASNLLARQIEQGAPADLFFSADEAKMDELDRKGLILPDTRRSLLSNSLVLVVRGDATLVPRVSSDLAKPEYKTVALAQPQSVPAGIYARAYLEKVGLWNSIEGKIVPTENVRAALTAVESGNVDAGFVYKTDSLLSRRVKIAVAISAAEGPRISYPVAVTKSSANPARAREFAQYLTGLEARAIFERMGFVVLK